MAQYFFNVLKVRQNIISEEIHSIRHNVLYRLALSTGGSAGGAQAAAAVAIVGVA